MNSIIVPSFFSPLPPLRRAQPRLHLPPRYSCFRQRSLISRHSASLSPHFLCNSQSSIGSTIPSNGDTISTINFEDFADKDWSFLDKCDPISDEVINGRYDRILSAGKIEDASKVLVSIGSEAFVDRIVNSWPNRLLLVVHDSIFVLASIKEKYDNVKCWQGELVYVPDKWTPLDAVFLYFLPALPFGLDQIFGAVIKRISPGARVVISHPQGRNALVQQRQQYPEVVISDLPDETTLQSIAADHSFEMVEFVDEPDFYLAVLKFGASCIE